VRYPALAVNASGDVLLAYSTNTRKSHLSRRGAVAVTYRRAGGSFSAPVVVDRTPSSAPVVALAPDGTGIVAWTHDRRVYSVSVAGGGAVGKVRVVRSPLGTRDVVAAAGKGGAATLAWQNHAFGRRERPRPRYFIRTLRRSAGGTFAAPRIVAVTREYVHDVAVAADESGRTTLAWTQDRFGDDRTVGFNGSTSAVLTSTASARGGFGRPRLAAPGGSIYRSPLALAAANGQVAIGWGYRASRQSFGVQAAIGPASAPGPPQHVLDTTLTSPYAIHLPDVDIGLAPSGVATAVVVAPFATAPTATARVLAIDGSA
jgi:hypothetical protein